jgi:hypothetical protein
MGWKKGSEGASGKGQRDVQPVAHMNAATPEKVLTTIDNPHEDNLTVQPVAQSPGIERSRQRLLLVRPQQV